MYLEKASELSDYTIGIRRAIHENPELSGEEEETVALVCDELEKSGIDYVNVNKGGVLGFIKGNKNVKNPKTILLRADLDALPVEEASENLAKAREVKSQNEGAMHACGHDGHTAMLLTVGKILAESRDDFGGEVILCFERGEEVGMNYRYIMAYIDEHDIAIDASYAIHVDPHYESGVMAIKAGNVNAGGVIFDVTIKGEGGHGARPYLATNPLDCFVDIYSSLQAMRMLEFSPFEPITYSIGAVEMGSQYNQIPDKLRFKGSMRFFDRVNVGYKFHRDFKNLMIAKARDHGCRLVFNTYTKPHFPIINDKVQADLAMKVMADEIGSDHIIEAEASMGSDSFSIYTAQWPGLYLMLGIANKEKGSGAALHSSKFDLDEDALKYGVAATCRYAVEFLNSDLEIKAGPYKNNIRGIFKEEGRSVTEIDEIYKSISKS